MPWPLSRHGSERRRSHPPCRLRKLPRSRFLSKSTEAASVHDVLYLDRRRVSGSPPKGSPVIVSCLARSSPSVVVGSDSFTSSPCTEPLTAPEKSGRPPTSILPVTAVPVCASVRVTGTETPPVPAYPVHVPATVALRQARLGGRRRPRVDEPHVWAVIDRRTDDD